MSDAATKIPNADHAVDIEKLARDVAGALPEGMAEKTQDMLDSLEGGATFGDMYGIEARKLEMVYSVARTFYVNKKYDDALKMFRFLTLMDHLNQKYWVGFGSTYQMMKDYEKAIEAYGFATILDIDNPKPQIQAGYCLIELGKYEEAICALEGVLLTDDLDGTVKLQAEALLARIDRLEPPKNDAADGAESSDA